METHRKTRIKKETPLLDRFYSDNADLYEISMDEAGRGCMFGRVYIASVVLPKNPELFSGVDIKDSKKFSSKTKLREAAEYIKQNAISWSIQWEDEETIDKINIRNATHKAMKKSITEILNVNSNTLLLIDGNDYTPYICVINDVLTQIPHECIEGGDNKYSAIAAASILAKTARDAYIEFKKIFKAKTGNDWENLEQ